VAQLFDLREDPHEFHNVAAEPEYADVFAELDRRLEGWMRRVGDPMLDGPVPTPYYRNAMASFWQKMPNQQDSG
jgi:hypothetical protein